ncbi:arginine vasopressin-induced protein 1 [Pelodytes ibericus]
MMGTPASVISSPPAHWQTPEPRVRKKASANIFKDIELLQIQTLFRTSGDEHADERAQIIYNYAEDRRIAEALIKLRPKKRKKAIHRAAPRLISDHIETLSVQNFSKLCINETNYSSAEPESDQPSASEQNNDLYETKKDAPRTTKKLRKERLSRVSGYLHQIRR